MRRAATFFLLWILFAGFIFGLFAATYWYWEARRAPIAIDIATAELAGPRDPIIVRFSRAVRPDTFDGQVVLEPAHPVRLEWHDRNHTLLVIPETHWALASEYRVSIGQGKTVWWGTTPQTAARVQSPAYPELVSTMPLDGAKDVFLGIEDPFEVTFDRSVNDFFIDFRFEPPTEVVYENNPEKTVFSILPRTALPEGVEHKLSLYAKWRGAPDTEYHLVGTTRFATKPPLPKTWSRDLALRAEEAKRLTRPKRTEGKYIDINLASQVMTLFENGRALDAYIISSGQRGMDTPTGEFAIRNKAPRPWSKQYGLYMPHWQAITPDGKYGIHELPEWPGGYKEGANHLGTPVSHGCVRLGVGAAERVYAWSEVGTPVVIY